MVFISSNGLAAKLTPHADLNRATAPRPTPLGEDTATESQKAKGEIIASVKGSKNSFDVAVGIIGDTLRFSPVKTANTNLNHGETLTAPKDLDVYRDAVQNYLGSHALPATVKEIRVSDKMAADPKTIRIEDITIIDHPKRGVKDADKGQQIPYPEKDIYVSLGSVTLGSEKHGIVALLSQRAGRAIVALTGSAQLNGTKLNNHPHLSNSEAGRAQIATAEETLKVAYQSIRNSLSSSLYPEKGITYSFVAGKELPRVGDSQVGDRTYQASDKFRVW